MNATTNDGLDVMRAVVALLPNASLEYPGFISHPDDAADRFWSFGVANGAWSGDLMSFDGADCIDSVDLGIAADESDADKIATAIIDAIAFAKDDI